MFHWIPSIPPVLELTVLVATALGAIVAIKKYAIDPIVRFNRRINAGMDSLLGYPEVKDPGSGSVLKDATPPLALRVEKVESAIILLTQTTQENLALREEFAKHVGWSEGWVAGIEARLSKLEKPPAPPGV